MPGFHLVVLGPVEPSPELVDLLRSPVFEGRLFYITGSALNIHDLVKARVDAAAAIMFLSNPELDTVGTVLDDAATVLRTLSVINFNPDLECLVQVLQASDRNLLKDSDVDLVLCMDDYKTTLQARNAMCPGLATFVENIFHSFGSGRNNVSKPTDHWMSEYQYGLQMELYYINIDQSFFQKLGFHWRLLVEVIFLEYECMLLGVCRASDQSLCLNPDKAEFQTFPCAEEFFRVYTTGVLLAPDDATANAIAFALTDIQATEHLLEQLVAAENLFAVRTVVLPTAAVACKDMETTGLGSRTLRRLSAFGATASDQTPQLIAIKESQHQLAQQCPLNISPDRKKRNKGISLLHDSEDSDDGDNFLGYIESDSEDESDVESTTFPFPFQRHDPSQHCRSMDSKTMDHNAKRGNNDMQYIVSRKGNPDPDVNRLKQQDIARKPPEVIATNSEVNSSLKSAAKLVMKKNCQKKMPGWLNVIRALNIHGEVEVEDDASSLALLQYRKPSAMHRREYCGKANGANNQGVRKVPSFRQKARLAMILSSAPTPSHPSPHASPPPKKVKLTLRGAGRRVTAGLHFNNHTKKQKVSGSAVTTSGEPNDMGKISRSRLVLNQSMNGFHKKNSPSHGDSYNDGFDIDLSSSCSLHSKRSVHSVFASTSHSSNSSSSGEEEEEEEEVDEIYRFSPLSIPEGKEEDDEACFFMLKLPTKKTNQPAVEVLDSAKTVKVHRKTPQILLSVNNNMSILHSPKAMSVILTMIFFTVELIVKWSIRRQTQTRCLMTN